MADGNTCATITTPTCRRESSDSTKGLSTFASLMGSTSGVMGSQSSVNGNLNSSSGDVGISRIASMGSIKDVVVHDAGSPPSEDAVDYHMLLSPYQLQQLCGAGIGNSDVPTVEIKDV